MKKILSGSLLFLVIALSGCATHKQEVRPEVVPYAPSVPGPAVPATAGSLWTEQQGGLFYDIKARNVGDIVTVAIYEQASASKEASTATGRETSASADITKFFGLEDNIGRINRSIDPTALVKAGYKNDFTGTGKTSRKEDLLATLTARVIEVLPNGNLRIAGGKTVTVNHEDQIIQLAGIIRPMDISPQNVVDSKYILDANIEYTGNGIISDKQRPGWMVRILDNIWPF